MQKLRDEQYDAAVRLQCVVRSLVAAARTAERRRQRQREHQWQMKVALEKKSDELKRDLYEKHERHKADIDHKLDRVLRLLSETHAAVQPEQPPAGDGADEGAAQA